MLVLRKLNGRAYLSELKCDEIVPLVAVRVVRGQDLLGFVGPLVLNQPAR